MKDFPDFMKNKKDYINSDQQYMKNIDGYYFDGKDGNQMAFWNFYEDNFFKAHKHEYVVCVCGQYIPGTRIIYAFGGKRIQNKVE